MKIIFEILGHIKSHLFIQKFAHYLEGVGDLMKFRNKNHKKAFEGALKKIKCKNNAVLSALYLLTADYRLWQIMKHCIQKNRINFDLARLKGTDEEAYFLFCTAKDLVLGTKHLCISDLADKSLTSPLLFALICNATVIRRTGTEFLWKGGEMHVKNCSQTKTPS